MVKLTIQLPTNPEQEKREGFRYYHTECYHKKLTYFHFKKVAESDFKEIFLYLDGKLKDGNLIPFKTVSDYLYLKMPFKSWRKLFDEWLMKYIKSEMKQSVLDYAANGYLEGTLNEFNLTRELYIVEREKGNQIRIYNGGLYIERRKESIKNSYDKGILQNGKALERLDD